MRKVILLLVIGLLSACTNPQASPTSIPVTRPESTPQIPGFSEDMMRTLASLRKVDEYPLYTMQYYGEYDSLRTSMLPFVNAADSASNWACSLFTILHDGDHLIYGRNFDWDFSPALLLFTHPPDSYASVSVVDLEYLNFNGDTVYSLTSLPLEERDNLLDAPWLPFDGMNEYGLAIGMAAVPSGNMQPDPSKQTIGSLGIMREILDHARNVDEAVTIIKDYNIVYMGGPSIHYLIADAEGRAVLVEFYQGKMYVIENEQAWHLATNFLVASVKDPLGYDARYDRIHAHLSEKQGLLDPNSAMDLLSEVAQESTQWSVVYQMARQEVNIVMAKDYTSIYTFQTSDYFDSR